MKTFINLMFLILYNWLIRMIKLTRIHSITPSNKSLFLSNINPLLISFDLIFISFAFMNVLHLFTISFYWFWRNEFTQWNNIFTCLSIIIRKLRSMHAHGFLTQQSFLYHIYALRFLHLFRFIICQHLFLYLLGFYF